MLPLGAVLVVALALLYSLSSLTATDREFMRQELEGLFGKGATIDDLGISLWGGIGFSAKEFQIADHPRFAANPLVHAKELKLGVSFVHLLLGRVVVTSLILYEPELQIITDEEGILNLAWQKKELGALPITRAVPPGKNHAPVTFRITRLRITRGRVDFIDRSVKEPAEMQIRNVEMTARGLLLSGRTRVKLAAAITGGLGHDVRIDGELGSFASGGDWSEGPLQLAIECDSLQIPMITRAIPFFRDKVPRELNVTGPLSLRAKVGGTVRQPKVTDFRLKAPLFGASDYNAILTGTAELDEYQSWSEAKLNGTFVLDPVDLDSARKVSFFRESLPADVVTRGTIGIHSRFEGSWRNLRAGVLVRADDSEIRYGNWVRKPRGTAAHLQAQVSRQKNRFLLHNSVLTLGTAKLALSGTFDDLLPQRWRLNLSMERHPVAAWEQLVSFPASFYPVNGVMHADMLIKRDVTVPEGWDLQGTLNLQEAEFRDKQARRRIEQLSVHVLFLGKEARIETASFRLGASSMEMTGRVTIGNDPFFEYELRSADLNLPDLTTVFDKSPVRLKDLIAKGRIRLHSGAPWLETSLYSTEGSVDRVGYRHLRADLSWSPTGVKINNLSARTLNGSLHSVGHWSWGSGADPRLELASEMESINIADLLARLFPRLRQQIEGRLNFKGRFVATTKTGAVLADTLEGAGEAELHNGSLRDFNLLAQLLSSPGGSPALNELPASLAALLSRTDTPLDTLHATLTVDGQRLRTHELHIETPDYTITAAGWIGFDNTTRWNGLLVLSPHLTREIQQNYRSVRLLVDRRGHLALPFRVEGKLSDVKARLDNRALMQSFRRGSPEMPDEPRDGGGKRDTRRQEWLPEPLKQLLNR